MENDLGLPTCAIKEETKVDLLQKCDPGNFSSFTDDDVEDIKVKLEPIVTDEIDIKAESDETQCDELQQSVHAGGKTFECNICRYKFTSKSNLRVHLRIHFGEKPYECKVCEITFTRNNDLQRHVKIHTGEKAFECKVCRKKFTDRSTLRGHIRIHTGEKPYQCKICKKTFARSYSLGRHLTIHTGEKLFEFNVVHLN